MILQRAPTTLHVTNAAGCTSPASANVVIDATATDTDSPGSGSDHTTHLYGSDRVSMLSGLPAGNWTINPGNITGNTATTTINGLATGTYNFTVTNAAGCTSPASANVVINPQPADTGSTGSGSDHPTYLYRSNRLSSAERITGRHWTINPGSHHRQYSHHNDKRTCNRHLQLYSHECSRMYFTCISQCGDQSTAG